MKGPRYRVLLLDLTDSGTLNMFSIIKTTPALPFFFSRRAYNLKRKD
jgi:hypothetical protein